MVRPFRNTVSIRPDLVVEPHDERIVDRHRAEKLCLSDDSRKLGASGDDEIRAQV